MDRKTMAYIVLGLWQAQAPDAASRAICENIFNEMLDELGAHGVTTWESMFKQMVHALDEAVNWHTAPWLWQPQLDAEEKPVTTVSQTVIEVDSSKLNGEAL